MPVDLRKKKFTHWVITLTSSFKTGMCFAFMKQIYNFMSLQNIFTSAAKSSLQFRGNHPHWQHPISSIYRPLRIQEHIFLIQTSQRGLTSSFANVSWAVNAIQSWVQYLGTLSFGQLTATQRIRINSARLKLLPIWSS